MKEIWKDIPGFEGRYQASTQSRFRSLDRHMTVNRSNGTYECIKKGIILSQWKQQHASSKHYYIIKVSISGKDYISARLLALTFLDNPENKKEINHIDSDSTNNNLDNIEWCTRSENILHSYSNGIKKPSKLYHYNISKDNIKYNNLTAKEASKIINCHPCSISTGYNRGDLLLYGWSIEKL